MSKKIFSLLLSLIMVLSLCACGDKKDKDDEEKNSKNAYEAAQKDTDDEEKSPKNTCEAAQREITSAINTYLMGTSEDYGQILIGKDGALELDCYELDEESFKELFDGNVPHCEESDITVSFYIIDGNTEVIVYCEEHPSDEAKEAIENAKYKTCMANQREITAQLTSYSMYESTYFSGTIMLERNKVNCDNAVGIDAETFESLFQEVPYCPTGKTIVINFLMSSDGTLAIETSCAEHGSC